MTKHNPKNGQDFWMFKAPPLLKQKLDEIRIERIKKGKDKQMRSYNRLGLAIARHDDFLRDLINADLKEK